MTLAETLRARRTTQGLSMGALASMIGVSVATVSMWEQGKQRPSLVWDRTMALARALDMNPTDLWWMGVIDRFGEVPEWMEVTK